MNDRFGFFFTHRITNAVAEGLNSRIQTIKHQGYRGV
ncbi:MAG: transposase [Betaproteobacteria bacterium]|nr:transposase [Betaproteobacteria bacterium]